MVVATSDITSAAELSLCLWLKLSTSHSGYAQVLVLGTSGTSWNNIRCGIDTNGDGRIYFNVSSGSANTYIYSPLNYKDNIWHHITGIYNSGSLQLYIDGIQVATGTTTNVPGLSGTSIYVGGNAGGEKANNGDCLNDIRIYNHALSAKEVKEISKGLMLHYNFEDNCQQLVNAYDEPTFNTSTATGGWKHWGSTGHAGSYAQNTDANYIYPGFSTYSHKVANGSNATKDYLLYQEKLFDGGYRSMQAIIKASDGAAITDSVCYPAWNGRNGGVASGSWTSIESIGNGFYLCKAEGIKQTTSPSNANAHLVGIYVKPGKTIYVTCCYLENGKQLCSDIFDPSPKCYDCSGYGYNGTISGNIQLSSDSAAGKHSIYSPAGANYVERQNFPIAGFNADQQFTINAWIKIVGYVESTSWNTIFRLAATDARDQQLHFCYNSSGNIILSQYSDDPQFTTNVALNTWAMVTWVHYKEGSTAKCKYFVNGQQVGSTQSYSGLLSIQDNARLTLFYDSIRNNYASNLYMGDFKIYSTALSAEDILAEYNRKAAIDKKGNLFTGEFIESNVSSVKVDKANFIAGNNIVEGTDKVKFADKYTQLEYIQNTGTTTISTGYQLDMDSDSVEVEFQATTTDQNGMILASSGGNYWWVYHYSSLIHCYLDGTDGGQQNLSGPSRDTNKHTAVYQNKTYYVDNVAYNTASGTLGTTTQQLYFFAYNAGGSYPYKGKIYRCKIWNASQLVKDFIPAKRNSDNTIGMYDLVNRVFHAPTGSGTFTAGPEIGNISAIYANKIEEL